MQAITKANRHQIAALLAAELAGFVLAGIRCSAVPAGAAVVAGLVLLAGIAVPAGRFAAAVATECH